MSAFRDNILETIRKYNLIDTNDRIVVGLSGGADSCALLHSLSQLSQTLGIWIIAAHLNHGIRQEEAMRDEEFSKTFAGICNVDFVSKTVDVPEYARRCKISDEMAGRQLRYEFFDEVSRKYNCSKIAVAHNQNDRVETIFLNLTRGTGSDGFEGIKPKNGNVIRPLIETSRTDIECYAHENDISYVTDSTNLTDVYARNIIRNKVIPELEKINPGVITNILRCSDIVGTENDFAENLISSSDIFRVKEHEVLIDKSEFISLHRALARRTLLKGIKLLCGNTLNVSLKQVDSVCENLKTGNVFRFGNDSFAIVTANQLILTDVFPETQTYNYKVAIPGTIRVEEIGCEYKFEYVTKYQHGENILTLSMDDIDENKLNLRSKQEGDLFTPFGMKGSKKIKNFFIDSKIPSHHRLNYPLLVCDNLVCAVLPLRINNKCRVTSETKKILKITKIGGTYDEQ